MAIRDLKAKSVQQENQIAQLNLQILEWRTKMDKKEAEEQKLASRDKKSWLEHFGREATPKDEKYLAYVRMYENQSEKLRKELAFHRDQPQVEAASEDRSSERVRELEQAVRRNGEDF